MFLCVFICVRNGEGKSKGKGEGKSKGKDKLQRKIYPRKAMKAETGHGSIALLFFNLGSRWSGWSTPSSSRFSPRERHPVPIVQETVQIGLRIGLNRCGKCCRPIEIRPAVCPYSFPCKGKAIPLQAWTGPEDSRRLRLPDFKTIGT